MKRNNYSIGAKNGLLELKHYQALGSAIWLYLWFLDKQPKNTDKVLGGKPITYQMFAENFPGLPRVTYVRWLDAIRKGGYVDMLRTPRGYVVTINKAKKWVDSDVSKPTHHSNTIQSDVSNFTSDVSNSAHAEDVSKSIHAIKSNSLKKQRVTINTLANKSPEHEKVSKLYYQIIKSYELPKTNNNNIRKWIKQMTTEVDYAKLISYLEFILDTYPALELEYKPHINTAFDIYAKRVQIENILKASVKEQEQNKVFRI